MSMPLDRQRGERWRRARVNVGERPDGRRHGPGVEKAV
jgi:hypothetical protein